MGYLYENSNPERFQHLCQSLFASSYPSLQCFPIGQPDGGRDGWDPETKTVLQVKFKRADEGENADWLIEALEAELPKVRRLAEMGASQYIMATNARGTAHLATGRIDKVQKWLDENMPLSATCFWRDDIDRRLDNAPASLKMKYSELISLEDGVEVVLSAVLGSIKERQQDALRAFVAAQFELDRTVKFKQVSLSNDLLGLFIDVPVGFSRNLFERTSRTPSSDNVRALLSALTGSDRQFYMDDDVGGPDVLVESETGTLRRLNIGTAELLLSTAAQDHLKLVVIEGAPGQGKSTLAQYVCQVHRARFLQRGDVLARLPEPYRQTAFRIPVKVDLRDYAAFLEGNSPFDSTSAPSDPRTLDVFLAQLIYRVSGGIDFAAHDVISLLKSAPTLLFLDGLDEVADMAARERLVASIGEALTRWNSFNVDLQVVVTSRPSVFGRSPSFGKFGFVTLALQNIDAQRINEYADRWVAARGLDASEIRDVKKILAEKLELAHIRDLTRNPMQLTILLSLIHQVGHSLPDQRTDLYGRYVDLFLTREADKSALVREHRVILLEFIQHLAWVLQTQAESLKTAGSISVDELQNTASEFLQAGGHSASIADDLFGGGLERIFVLVERIEGLYEFEVQPLREFFCARHLYSTAPVGTYRDMDLRGDRAQRFEALAANPLWFNVCRFYAGSCERGETGTLVLSLEELIKTGDHAVSSHARRVGLALLQDWVFSNVKFAQDQLIQVIFDESGTQVLLAGEGRLSDDLVLDVECGRDTLRDRVFQQLKTWPVDTRTATLCSVLRANGGEELSGEFADFVEEKSADERSYRLVRMFRAGAGAHLDPESAWNLIIEDNPSRDQLLLRSSELLWSEPELALEMPPLIEEFIRGVLDGLVRGSGRRYSSLGVFSDLLSHSPNLFLGLSRFAGVDDLVDNRAEGEPAALLTSVVEFLDQVAGSRLDRADGELNQFRSPVVWSSIAEIARQQFGETWATASIAIRAAGIRSAIDLPEGSDKLFDSSIPICARARSARLRRGGPRWWIDQLKCASSPLEQRLWAGLVLMWSSAKNLYALADEVNQIVDSLEGDEYDAMRRTLVASAARSDLRADRKRVSELDLKPFSARVAVLVAVVFRADTSVLVRTTRQEREEPLRSFLKQRRSLEEVEVIPSWQDAESSLEWARRITALRRRHLEPGPRVRRHLIDARLRTDSAKRVMEEPKAYPAELVARAVMEVQRRYRPGTLARVAMEQDWAFR